MNRLTQGYKWIIKPDHPFVHKHNNRVLEHRLVWEEHNKAILLPWAVVHHKNENRLDNRIENLKAMIRNRHNFIHKPKKDMSNRICSNCNSNKTAPYKHKNGFEYFSWYKDGKGGWLCRYCRRHPNRSTSK